MATVVDRVQLDRELSIRAVCSMVTAARRHWGVESVEVTVDGTGLELSPVTEETAAIVRGDNLRDLAAAAGRRSLEAQGATVTARDGALLIALPSA